MIIKRGVEKEGKRKKMNPGIKCHTSKSIMLIFHLILQKRKTKAQTRGKRRGFSDRWWDYGWKKIPLINGLNQKKDKNKTISWSNSNSFFGVFKHCFEAITRHHHHLKSSICLFSPIQTQQYVKFLYIESRFKDFLVTKVSSVLIKMPTYHIGLSKSILIKGWTNKAFLHPLTPSSSVGYSRKRVV